MAAPIASVIVPVFNRRRYVREAVESVLAQTLAGFELIVVDDGSTDGSLAEVRRVEDPRLRVVERPHAGVAAALNSGIAVARGRYLAKLGSDDRWAPSLLERQVGRLEADDSLGLVYARGRAIDAAGQLLDETWGYPLRFPGDPLRSLLYDDCTCDITVVVRRELAERAGPYDESLPANVDWDMWLRVARQQARFAFTDEVLAYFRLHPGNLTGRRSPAFPAKIRSRRQVLDKAFADPESPPAIQAFRAVAYRNLHINAGLMWLTIGEVGEAWAAFERAARAGCGVLPTAARILATLLAVRVLKQGALGRALLDGQAAARQAWRELLSGGPP